MILSLLVIPATASPSTRVKSYTTKKGTLVNYGTKGNTNPFTGKKGKRKAF